MRSAAAASIPIFSAKVAERNVDLGAAVGRVLARHQYILGPEVAAFEEAFAAYCGTAECVGVANGTDALEIALRALSVGAGDAVAVVANAGGYSTTAVRAVGATPVYVDIDPARRTMSPDALRAAIGRSLSAIVVTHLYGQLAEMDAVMEIASQAGVPVIEDCAQAHGARHAGRRAGAFGSVGCFSFYPTKNLGAIGDAGALVTNDPHLAREMRAFRQYGWSHKYRVERPGGRNSRLDEIQAAVLLDKLPHLDEWNAQRRRIAGHYRDALADLPIDLPPSTGEDFVAHLFVIELDRRDEVRDALGARGVGCDVHYPLPDHLQQGYAPAGESRPQLPATERSAARVLSIPCYPGLTDDAITTVIDALSAAVAATRS